ncbi:Solute carrier family 12 member 2 [Toxocara canis]|uniref:Solute carrier family 12 member 9 n=1 Tax=Toxocara canis TaxID=6265 RepID=A0A0B2VT09_TOXCA|nr:Solute carrier family 12 member 2 [Toxocara canis]
MRDSASAHAEEASEAAKSLAGETTEDGDYPGTCDTLTRHQSMPSLHSGGHNAEGSRNYLRPPKEGFKQVMFAIPSDNQLDALPEGYNDAAEITLERPPTIDNYRMTIQNLRNSRQPIRPSMIELMHGAREAARAQKESPKPSYDFCSDAAEITLERPPTIDNYRMTIQNLRNSRQPIRPSMIELMHGAREAARAQKEYEIQRSNQARPADDVYDRFKPRSIPEEKKIDFFQGVFIPVFTNIVGSLLYLRNGWVAGQAGIIAGLAVVLLSTLVCVVTAVSICGISSNGIIRKGGLYYLVSRSLGPEFGGSIGAIFALANAMMASLYVVSVAETVSDLMSENDYGFVTNNKINDIRLFGILICLVLMLITFAGPDIEQSFTLFMFSLYFLSFFNWCLGSIIPPNDDQRLRGMTGYSFATISQNLLPAWRGEDFISVFAVFFPGMTGLMAGSMFINSLRDPARDVPLGMFTSIAVCSLFNLIGVFISGATMLRDVSGLSFPVYDNVTNEWESFTCAENFTCKYGLMNFFQVAELEAAWGPLIIAGIFAMSLSSTMTNLDNGPQIFQAICKDQLFPFVRYFSKEYDLSIPQRAYIFFSLITMGIILIGDLNIINGLVSNLFLAAYASVNYACFDASFAKSPGFRPSFRFYNMWLSLASSALCIIVMFIISWISALIIFAFFFILFIYMNHRHVEANWGSSVQANSYRIALTSLLKLANIEEHVKNYRPQILLMCGNPAARSTLLDFAANITKDNSLLIAAHVVPYAPCERLFVIVRRLDIQITAWLLANKIKAFYLPFANENVRSGAQHLLQIAGLGKLRPNILMIGFKSCWNRRSRDSLYATIDYVGIIKDAFENNFGVGILRNGNEGFDLSETLLELNVCDITALKQNNQNDSANGTLLHGGDNASYLDTENMTDETSFNGSIDSRRSRREEMNFNDVNSADMVKTTTLYRRTTKFFADSIVFNSEKNRSEEDPKSSLSRKRGLRTTLLTEKQKKLTIQMNRFHHKIKNGVIDVWWLYDDGGLTLLIPHLLRLPKAYLEGAKLRVFTQASSQMCTEADERNMAAMLSKFRIEYADVRIIPDIKRAPSPATIRDFEEIIEPMRATESDHRPGLITDFDLSSQKCRTFRQLRTKELLQQHSSQADLIVVTLPVPRLEINSCLYMGWLDLMTRDLPPVLMIRGNQTSVLTFYS